MSLYECHLQPGCHGIGSPDLALVITAGAAIGHIGSNTLPIESLLLSHWWKQTPDTSHCLGTLIKLEDLEGLLINFVSHSNNLLTLLSIK